MSGLDLEKHPGSRNRVVVCAFVSLTLLMCACTEGNGGSAPEEPDRPSPAETVRTEELRSQIDEVEDACVLLEAEMVKEYLAEDEYEEPQETGRPTNVCVDSVGRSCPDSRASMNFHFLPEDSNVEAAEQFYDRTFPNKLMSEGYVAKSGDTDAYAIVYSSGYAAGYGTDSYQTGVYILGEFYVIRAELIITGDECMPTLEEVGPWLYEEYAPAVVESIEARLTR